MDAGISCRETEKRMKRLGLSMNKVKAIFISHEHTDHVRGLAVLARKYQLPVYITPGTEQRTRFDLGGLVLRPFLAYDPVQVGKLSVTAFPKYHDASDPHSFVVEYKGIKVGVFTDIGVVCEHLKYHFAECHAAFLEANYDEDLLEQGRYPYYLKNRIRGGRGHLANKQALELFMAYKPSFMSHVLLSHLSKDNNDPDLVKALFEANAGDTEVIVASRFEETPVFKIIYSAGTPARKLAPDFGQVQLGLFDELV